MTDGITWTEPMRCIAQALEGLAAPDELSFAANLRALMGSDLFHTGAPPAAILRPRDSDSLARCIAAVSAAGIPIVPRGGGISYSAGYVANRADALMIDMRGLNAVLDVDLENATVTVEAGCTWQTLDDHLHALGHRPCFWGPASGRDATIGGSLSQEAVLLGSGRFGTAGDNLDRLDVIAADGRKIAARRGGEIEPAALVGDCGALGIKVAATLRILPLPAAEAYAAWHFPDGRTAIQAQAQISAAGLASECFLFDRVWSSRRQGAASEAVETVPGHRHRPDAVWELHAAFEADTPDEAQSRRAAFTAICGALGGNDAGDGVMGHFHSHPFGPPMLLFGPEGKRWIPLHFIIDHDRHADMGDAIIATMQAHRTAIERHGIEWNWSSLSIGKDKVLLEPSLHWPDAQPAQAKAYFDEQTLAGFRRWPADPEARAAIHALRTDLADAGRQVGALHIQLGRLFPPDRAFAAWSFHEIEARKRSLDPHGLMNPGVLRLG